MGKQCRIGNTDFRICLMVSASFGWKNNYIAPVIHVGESLHYKNQTLWIRLDFEKEFVAAQGSEMVDLFVIRKRPGDQLIVLPSLDRFQAKVTPQAQKISDRNLARIQDKANLFFKTVQHHQEYEYPLIPDIDPDAALYQSGFFSHSEKKEISRFHGSGDELKAIVCEKILSTRVKTIANRILLRNFDSRSLPGTNIEYSEHLRRLFSPLPGDTIPGYRNDVKYTIAQGLTDLREICEKQTQLTPLQNGILAWLKIYMESLISSNAEPL